MLIETFECGLKIARNSRALKVSWTEKRFFSPPKRKLFNFDVDFPSLNSWKLLKFHSSSSFPETTRRERSQQNRESHRGGETRIHENESRAKSGQNENEAEQHQWHHSVNHQFTPLHHLVSPLVPFTVANLSRPRRTKLYFPISVRAEAADEGISDEKLPEVIKK